MSTLDKQTYEMHRPLTMVYQNIDIVAEGSTDRTALVLIGSQGAIQQNASGAENPGYYTKNPGLILIRSQADINKKLRNAASDTATPPEGSNNVLAECAEIALIAGGGEPFYCITTTVNGKDEEEGTRDGWLEAEKILKNNDRTMFVCPLDDTKAAAIAKTCMELSSAENQKWKRCYIGLASDTFTVSNGSVTGAVTSLTAKEKQRTCFIWSPGAEIVTVDDFGNTKTEALTHHELASGVAALRASVLPQQGLSRRTLPWVYTVPKAYTNFDTDSLNEIAVKGVFIVTQDDPDSDVYIRHQLTNDMSHGILYWEDSVGVNVDTICYGLKDIVKSYIGQRNNTQETLVEIKNRVTDYLLSLTSTGVSIDARRIGPQIKEIDLNSLIVKLDDTFKDRVLISVDIVVPIPLNQVHVHLNAFASFAEASE